MKKIQLSILMGLTMTMFITSCKHEWQEPLPDENDDYTGISFSKADVLSESRIDIAAAADGNFALFAGGYIYREYEVPPMVEEYDATKAVDVYNATTGTWTTDTLSIARMFMGATTLNGKMYFAGGETNWDISNRIDIYNTATNDWNIDSLPTARTHVGAAAANNKILFASGNTVDIYDIQTATWSTANLSGNVNPRSMTSCGDEVFISGYSNSNQVDIYNTITNTWRHEELSLPRINLAVGSAGKFVLFAGGTILSSGAKSDRVDIYNTETDTWETDTLSKKIDNLTAVSAGNLAIFSGDKFLTVYDIITGEWSESSLSKNRTLVAGVHVGNQVLFAGGSDGVFEPDLDHVEGKVEYGSDVADIFELNR